MPRLSIVITAAGNAGRMEDTLVSVLENRPSGCEVIVAHAGPYDDPYNLADEVRLVEAPRRADVLRCAIAGFQAASGQVIHLLDSGCKTVAGWTRVALKHFDDSTVGAVTPLLLDEAEPNRLRALGVGYGAGGVRRVIGRGLSADEPRLVRTPAIGPTLAASFYRRSAVEAAGGLAKQVGPELADVDLAISLRAMGYRSLVEPACRIYASAAADDEAGRAPGALRGGWYAERLFWRSAPSVGWIRALLLHGLVVGADVIGRLPWPTALAALAGRGVGCAHLLASRAHHRRLQAAPRPEFLPKAGRHGESRRIDPAHQPSARRQEAGAQQRQDPA